MRGPALAASSMLTVKKYGSQIYSFVTLVKYYRGPYLDTSQLLEIYSILFFMYLNFFFNCEECNIK